MKVQLFTFCDAATEWFGKLNIVGTFDTIFAPKIPTIHPACTVVSSIRFEAIEEGVHRIKFRFGDEDGREIIPAPEMQINVTVPLGMPYVTVNQILNIQQLKLPRFGEYSVDLAVDGSQEGSLSLFVREHPGPA
jgi:hypothetical protein